MNIGLIGMLAAIIIFVVIPSFRDRIIPVKRLIIAPAIFMYLLYDNITTNFYLNFINNLILLFGIGIGIISGILMRYKLLIKSDQTRQLIWLPGTYTTLVIFLMIFIVHFVIGFLKSVDPFIFKQTNYTEQILLFMLAYTSSITLGTSLCLYYKYRTTSMKINNLAAHNT